MARPRRQIRDGKALCDYHQIWEPIDKFDWHTYQSANGAVRRLPESNCQLAKQTLRDAEKERDPAGSAISGRAASFARELSRATGQTVGYQWILIELNWRALVPIIDAMLGPRGLCLNCGRRQTEARNYQLDHRVPPLSLTDWPAQHARNLWPACGGCNGRKARHDADREWLEREQHKWMIDREWSRHAGEPGWPPIDSSWPVVDLDGGEWPSGTLFRPYE